MTCSSSEKLWDFEFRLAQRRLAYRRRAQKFDKLRLVARQQLGRAGAERALGRAETQIGAFDPQPHAAIAQIAQELQRGHMTPSSRSVAASETNGATSPPTWA